MKQNKIMFSEDQIKTAHSKVKSGADFPTYIQDLIHLGVLSYQTYVSDGHTDYFGRGNYIISSSPQYDCLSVAEQTNAAQFKVDLKAHQHGETNYGTFCKDCAKSGMEMWEVCTKKMTCTYYDKMGNKLLAETIPH